MKKEYLQNHLFAFLFTYTWPRLFQCYESLFQYTCVFNEQKGQCRCKFNGRLPQNLMKNLMTIFFLIQGLNIRNFSNHRHYNEVSIKYFV